MLVRFLGVALALAEGLTVADLFAQMKKKNGDEFPHRGSTRIMHVDKVGNYHVGVIVSVKDHQTLMRRRKEGGRWTVKPDEKQVGAEMVDFNFLALHHLTGRGLYQHYRGSLQIQLLENILSREQSALVNERRDEWVKANAGSAAMTTLLKKSRGVHKGQLFLRNIVRQQELKALISQLDAVTALQVDVLGVASDANSYQPIAPYVKSTRMRFSFNPSVSGQSVASKIFKLVGKGSDGTRTLDIDGGRIEGVEKGVETVFDFDSYPASKFATYKFDEVATEFRPDEFTKAHLLKELLRVCQDNKTIFERPSK